MSECASIPPHNYSLVKGVHVSGSPFSSLRLVAVIVFPLVAASAASRASCVSLFLQSVSGDFARTILFRISGVQQLEHETREVERLSYTSHLFAGAEKRRGFQVIKTLASKPSIPHGLYWSSPGVPMLCAITLFVQTASSRASTTSASFLKTARHHSTHTSKRTARAVVE